MFILTITNAAGHSEEHKLGSGKTTIGSDSTSTISLSKSEGLLAQHILLAPDGDGCWVGTVPGAPLRNERGEEILGQYVNWGTRLYLGKLVFTLDRQGNGKKVARRDNSETPSPDTAAESKKTSPVLLMTLILAFAYLGFQLLAPPQEATASLPMESPVLFDDDVACSSKNAKHRAEFAREAASAKQERSVFHLQDGVSAVELFAESDSCYRAVGLDKDAEEVRSQGALLRQSLEAQYRLLRLRLERALHKGNVSSAMSSLGLLRDLLSHRSSHTYVLSLRRLELSLIREKKTKGIP